MEKSQVNINIAVHPNNLQYALQFLHKYTIITHNKWILQ